jgi:sugar-specific transcriptional regulator TrmB
MPFGAGERALLESAAAGLYDEIVAAQGLSATDARIADDDGADRAAFDLLVELGLVHLDDDSGTWLPEDPASVQARVVAPLNQEAGALLEESAQWARALGSLSQSWRRSPLAQAQGRGPFTYLRDQAIGPYLAGLIAEAESELITAQPQSGRDASSVAAAVLRDTAALDRGIRMRTLYQHSARRSTFTQGYVAEVTARGAEVRTLDEFFNRMIIVDRRVAVIPASEDNRSAVAVSEPSVVAFLVDIFERTWERARPFTSRDATVLRSIAAEQRAMTIRMLIEGHSDPVSAKRLGVSPRTYAGYIADLKTEYEADTRFQLGYIMGEAGINGQPGTDGPEDDAGGTEDSGDADASG